ncbi:hypothetical protein BBW65_03450 [Helicobacter enhydrae]|uniref:Outer membrane beta-barrel protein n=1 Tax=Helicobacter enhydrae TaxID=222136 RepID=A0A1B1U5A3_9HELI|nr:outer membrane beta-barrel protein [Helicobacter enhydrae]ANV97911.1 hypothetical protein BBW65_03450 [Helicobacter enhydrae]
MRKFLLTFLTFFSFCFAELRVVEQTKEIFSGFFGGVSIGVGANALTFNNIYTPTTKKLLERNQSFASFVLSAKLGWYHYIIPTIGLRYYYNLDLNLTPFGEFNMPQKGTYDAYGFSTAHTLNVDTMIQVFQENRLSIDAIAGMGMGAIVGETYAKQGDLIYKSLLGDPSSYLNFDFRFNLGVRAMVDRRYGVEFMMRLPVVPTTIYKEGNSNAKQAPFYFTLDFIAERF